MNWSRREFTNWATVATVALGAPSRGAPAAPPISSDDFVGDLTPEPQSAGFDPARPFLFDGLAPRFATGTVRSCFIMMRDGVRLSTDFHIPVGARLPLPVVVMRTPYNKRRASHSTVFTQILPEQGFVVAVQDVRGRYESEGEFVANTGQDREDGYDTVDWITKQPWCNGAVGAMGSSYVGETTAKLAAARHPNHRASIIMFDGASAVGLSRCGAFMQGGVPLIGAMYDWFRNAAAKISYGPPAWIDRQTWFRDPRSQLYAALPSNLPAADADTAVRSLPAADALDRTGAAPSDFAAWMRHADDPDGAFFAKQGFLGPNDHVDTPTLHVTGPLEQGGGGFDNFALFRRNGMSERARRYQHLLLTPAPHSGIGQASARTMIGARDFGDTRFPYYKLFVDWFGHWLRGDANATEQLPAVRYFVGGRNAWSSTSNWPPADAKPLSLHLRGGGRLDARPPARDEGAARFRYDPKDPTPSELPGDKQSFVGGYFDRASLEKRGDLLVYCSAPLKEDLEIAGPVSVVLHVSSSAPDTDFAAVLCEGTPDGRAINITQGLARMRFREGLDRKVWMTPGVPVEVRIDLWHAALRVPQGHHLRLHIASAHFPLFARNLNTGSNNETTSATAVADNAIHHPKGRGSRIELFVRRG